VTCDVLIFLFFAIFIAMGYKKGFVRSVYSTMSVLISVLVLYCCKEVFTQYVVSSSFGDIIYDFFARNYSEEIAKNCSYAVTYILSIIVLYVIIRFVIKTLFGVMDFMMKLPMLNIANKILGLALGAISGAIWIIVVINVLYCFPQTKDFVETSVVAEKLNMLAVDIMR